MRTELGGHATEGDTLFVSETVKMFGNVGRGALRNLSPNDRRAILAETRDSRIPKLQVTINRIRVDNQ